MQRFRRLSIRIALVKVITWNMGDQISSTTDASILLDAFADYLGGQITTDSNMLITYVFAW